MSIASERKARKAQEAEQRAAEVAAHKQKKAGMKALRNAARAAANLARAKQRSAKESAATTRAQITLAGMTSREAAHLAQIRSAALAVQDELDRRARESGREQ
ncbi:hypothetical protein R77564_03748 [Ralstonia sp. LMG 32965]|uniref:Uncharacterized protein n=1 Tax=Ralstonia flatus TaxID=3058601 RepID=A0ABN9KFU3_9RALS|nr:hypothetical protein R77564_03748 [Ralstonia sp. LMG 32965]